MILYVVRDENINAVGTKTRCTRIMIQKEFLSFIRANIGRNFEFKAISTDRKTANLLRTENIK